MIADCHSQSPTCIADTPCAKHANPTAGPDFYAHATVTAPTFTTLALVGCNHHDAVPVPATQCRHCGSITIGSTGARST